MKKPTCIAIIAASTGLAVSIGLAVVLLIAPVSAQPVAMCDTPSTSFCNSSIALPADWNGHRFVLSQDYPKSAPTDAQPWLAFDPRTQPEQYINAVLSYFYEGNVRSSIEDSFDPKLNTVRRWYNAPWQDFGTNGREPVHGLTRERVSRPGELDPQQTHSWNNYAVGFYNAPGAVAIGRMWARHGQPNASAAVLPEGTVAAKLLFTTAPPAEVPYLQGAPEWDAYIFANPNSRVPPADGRRAILKVRLLQIDIAVKDHRAGATGWVFGTFVYGGGPGGAAGSGWTHVLPVGLMWGNDPNYSGAGPLQETWLNPTVNMPHVGYQGRLNGPVDNPSSACMSCHMTAENPSGVMVPPQGVNPSRWFQNIPTGTPFDLGSQSMDYSLQLAVGLANFKAAAAVQRATTQADRQMLLQRILRLDALPPRDGGTIH